MINSEELWNDYVQAYDLLRSTSQKFYTSVDNKLHFIRLGLIGLARPAAMNLVKNLPIEDIKELFRDILELAVYTNGYTIMARNTLLKIQKDWLVEHIEEYTAPILARRDYEEYSGVIHIYELIDKNLALELAQIAAADEDEDIRDIGELHLERLKDQHI